MNVAPRRPLKTAVWTLRSLLCLSANMILHIHFILSDADLNNFYEALWGEGGPKLAKSFFFSFSLFFSRQSPGNPHGFFLFVFHFERERERSTREGIMKAKSFDLCNEFHKRRVCSSRWMYECLALLNLCAHLKVVFGKLGCGYFVMWCNFRWLNCFVIAFLQDLRVLCGKDYWK